MTRLKFIPLVTLLLIICSSWKFQDTADFEFDDCYGNFITIKQIDKVPAPLDTAFFQSEIKGTLFDKTQPNSKLRFHYLIEIKPSKGKSEFEFRVMAIPRTKDIAEILKYQGWSHYLVAIKQSKGRSKIKSVEFLSPEI